MPTAIASRTYTLAEYLAFEARAAEKHEFVDGYIIPMAGSKGPHNLIAANTITALNVALMQQEQRYMVLSSDQKIFIPATKRIRYADTLVVCERMEYLDEQQTVLINPLLIVEVLSPGTESGDRGPKFHEYQSIPSFREYILIDQEQPHVTAFFQEEVKRWRISETQGLKASISLRSVPATLKLSELYRHVI